MKIAVTYDNGQVWQHFGKTENFKFYEVTESKVLHSEIINTGDGHLRRRRCAYGKQT